MAASTANQKVFVPLTGVLKVQDYIRSLEARIANLSDLHEGQKEQRVRLIYEHRSLMQIISMLELQIEGRVYTR